MVKQITRKGRPVAIVFGIQLPWFGPKSKGGREGRPYMLQLEVVYTDFTFSACQPFGPLTTSN